MKNESGVHWTDISVDLTKGCDGCELASGGTGPCFARVLTNRFGWTNSGMSYDFHKVMERPGRGIEVARLPPMRGQRRPHKPWLDGMPMTIFVGVMTDSLSQAISFEYLYIELIEPVMSAVGRNHYWLWLSKRPWRMAEFSRWLEKMGVSWPPNLWAGTSITDASTVGRVRQLEQVGDASTLRFLSVEPQMGPVDLDLPGHPGIGWVIQGGMSGSPAAPFGLNLAYDMIRRCREVAVPLFIKQLGSRPYEIVTDGPEGQLVEFNLPKKTIPAFVSGKDRARLGITDFEGGDWTEWPEDLRVREFPDPQNLRL